MFIASTLKGLCPFDPGKGANSLATHMGLQRVIDPLPRFKEQSSFRYPGSSLRIDTRSALLKGQCEWCGDEPGGERPKTTPNPKGLCPFNPGKGARSLATQMGLQRAKALCRDLNSTLYIFRIKFRNMLIQIELEISRVGFCKPLSRSLTRYGSTDYEN